MTDSPRHMKYRLTSLIAFFFVLILSAQIDSEKKSIVIPAEEVTDPKADNELIIKPAEANVAEPADTKVDLEIPKAEVLPVAKRKPFSIVKEDKFENPADLFKEQLKRSLTLKKEDEKRNNGSRVTQYLGEFSTSAKRVNIIYRDHQYPDGDLIRVFVNGDIVQPRVLLETSYKGFFLTLSEGSNIIDFQALNQGTSGPNTAEFQVLDDNAQVISVNQWNLATGVKATITVVKEKEID